VYELGTLSPRVRSNEMLGGITWEDLSNGPR
jgi:hypothetical protein